MTGGDEKARDEAAVRTAIMLGAVIKEEPHCWRGGVLPTGATVYTIEGIDYKTLTPAGVAWLFLATHGIGIDEHGSPYPFAEAKPGFAMRKDQEYARDKCTCHTLESREMCEHPCANSRLQNLNQKRSSSS